MKSEEASECRVQVFVCTNERPAPKTGCKNFGGQEFYDRLKKKLKENGRSDIWLTRTGCLGFCNPVGTTVSIHSVGGKLHYYSEVTEVDLDFIWNEIVRQ
jgi:predicted metal-binding protein